MEIKINREIRNYTESMFFGLSMRQFIFAVIGCGMAVLLYFVLKLFFGALSQRIIERKHQPRHFSENIASGNVGIVGGVVSGFREASGSR